MTTHRSSCGAKPPAALRLVVLRRLILALGLAVVLLGSAPEATAQSQKKLPFEIDPSVHTHRPKYVHRIPLKVDPKEALQELLKEVQDKILFEDKLDDWLKKIKASKDFIKPDDLKKIDVKSPLVQQQIKNILGKQGLKNLPSVDPKKTAEIKHILDKISPPTPTPDNSLPGSEPPPNPVDPGANLPFEPDTTAADEPSVPAEDDDPLSKWFDKFVESTENTEFGRMLLESKSVREFILQTDWFAPQTQQKILGMEPGDMSKWLQKTPQVDWKNLLSKTLVLRPENLSLPPLPKLNFRPPGLGFLAGPGGTPTASGLSVGGVAVLVVLLAGVIVVLGMMLRRAGTDGGQRWHPGPWPVDPAQISTRGELVRAFDHLALLLLGRHAEHLNHRDIAAHVGGQAGADPARRHASDGLARLYEQARYAPAPEALAPEDMRQARADLCSLAGAARA